MPPALRSIISVMAGFIAMNFAFVILSLPLSLFHVSSGGSTYGPMLFSILPRLLGAMAAGAVAALVAGRKPIEHGVVFAALLLAFGLNALRHFSGAQPQWYQWLLVVAPPLCVVAGSAIIAHSTSETRLSQR